MNTPIGLNQPTHAIKAANAFFRIAGLFFKQVPAGLNESAQYIANNLSDYEAAATNLALSLELYLKGLTLLTKRRPEKTHDLLALFDDLPKPLRQSIEGDYEFRLKHIDPLTVTALEIVITPTPREPTPEEIGRADKGTSGKHDLRSILAAERNAFQTWRYLYEAGNPNGARLLRCNYGYLVLIINSVQAHLRPQTKNPANPQHRPSTPNP